jgi:hypothetical protein
METFFDSIEMAVSDSDLTGNQQQEFLKFLSSADTASLESIARLMAEDSVWVERLWENYSLKKSATKNVDNELWDLIVQKEIHEISDMDRMDDISKLMKI